MLLLNKTDVLLVCWALWCGSVVVVVVVLWGCVVVVWLCCYCGSVVVLLIYHLGAVTCDDVYGKEYCCNTDLSNPPIMVGTTNDDYYH